MAKTKKAKPAPASDKADALQQVIGQIEKQYGQGAIMQMDENSYAKIAGISTGALSLDLALGGVGIPQGRITDHRIGLTIYALTDFMNGNIQEMIDALAIAENAEKLRVGETIQNGAITKRKKV